MLQQARYLVNSGLAAAGYDGCGGLPAGTTLSSLTAAFASFASMWRVAADESTADSASDTILGHLAADLHLHASPLLISTDLTTLTPDERAALENPDIIAIDHSGVPATFTLSQLGITAPEATGCNVWKNETTTFTGVAVTLAAGQTEMVVIKPVS